MRSWVQAFIRVLFHVAMSPIRPEGAPILPALGSLARISSPTGQRFSSPQENDWPVGPKRISWDSASPGRCPGLGEPQGLRPSKCRCHRNRTDPRTPWHSPRDSSSFAQPRAGPISFSQRDVRIGESITVVFSPVARTLRARKHGTRSVPAPFLATLVDLLALSCGGSCTAAPAKCREFRGGRYAATPGKEKGGRKKCRPNNVSYKIRAIRGYQSLLSGAVGSRPCCP
jgi:hypothetical protein